MRASPGLSIGPPLQRQLTTPLREPKGPQWPQCPPLTIFCLLVEQEFLTPASCMKQIFFDHALCRFIHEKKNLYTYPNVMWGNSMTTFMLSIGYIFSHLFSVSSHDPNLSSRPPSSSSSSSSTPVFLSLDFLYFSSPVAIDA